MIVSAINNTGHFSGMHFPFSLVLKCVNPLAHEGQEYGSCQPGIIFIMVMAIWAVIALLVIIVASCWCWSQVRSKYKEASKNHERLLKLPSVIVHLRKF